MIINIKFSVIHSSSIILFVFLIFFDGALTSTVCTQNRCCPIHVFVELSSLDGVLRACAVPYRLADFLVIVVCRAAVSRVSSFGFAVAFPVVVKLAAISSMVSACLPRDGTIPPGHLG